MPTTRDYVESHRVGSDMSLAIRPNWWHDLFPCEEFDAFYDLTIAATSAPGYREEEIKKVAAHRIPYILESHRQVDGGLSSYLDR